MLHELKWNRSVADAFHHAVVSCNINQIPKVTEELIESKAWEKRYFNGHLYENKSLVEFITDKPVKGCGWEIDKITALLKQAKNLRVLRKWRKATTAPNHRPPESSSPVTTLQPQRGNTVGYIMDRLLREDQKELLAAVETRKMTAKAAARKAGWSGYQKSTPLEQIERLIPKLTTAQRRKLKAML